jgi:hypothetical protein
LIPIAIYGAHRNTSVCVGSFWETDLEAELNPIQNLRGLMSRRFRLDPNSKQCRSTSLMRPPLESPD